MNRVVIGSLGVLSLLAALAAGCAVVPSTETVEDGIVDLNGDELRDDVSGTDEENGSSGTSVVKSSVDTTPRSAVDTCAGCGPLPDPWANGPLPDPWSDPSSSSSSSGGSGTGGSTSSSSSSSGGNKH